MSRMKRPDAILFDVYATLLQNPVADWHSTFQAVADEQGLGIDGAALYTRWKKHEVGFRARRVNMAAPQETPPFKTYEAAWRECFERVFGENGLSGDAAGGARRVVEHMARCRPFPETVSTLTDLSARACLGVFSNADEDFLRPALNSCGLTSKFDAVASSESAGIYKPHPGAFEHILGLMDVAPGKAWYVGDHLYDDVRGAAGAGLTVVWVNRNGVEPPAEGARPDRTIGGLAELVELFDSVA